MAGADMQVAQTILAQLGGNRFKVMTGASSFSGGNNMLSFRLPRRMTKNHGAAMTITLAGDDTYTLDLLKMENFECISLDKREGIYVENLRETFTDMTGLDTSLGRMTG